MSLKAKILLSTSLFMVLVVGLLTLNLALDAAARRAREESRNARLLERLAADWVREAGGPRGAPDWDGLSRRLARSTLIDNWVIAEQERDRLAVRAFAEASPPRLSGEDTRRLAEAIQFRKVHAAGGRVYVPIEAAAGRVYGARFDLKPVVLPEEGVVDTLTSIFTVMALGTALLLLNAFIFLNRFVLRPLDELVQASKRVAEGDFSRKIPVPRAYDEMGKTKEAFNLMMERIASSQQTLRQDIAQARDRIRNTERRLFHAQRLSTTGTLAAGIAHEINNPLGGMMNAARMIQSGTLEEGKRNEYLALIVEGLGRIGEIVQKVLQFRPKEFTAEPVRLSEVVGRAIAFCEHRVRGQEVEVRNEVSPDLPLVDGDALELQQAVLNVVMNALDAFPSDTGRIRITGQKEGDRVRVSIEDNGSGMEEDHLVRCLDPFFTTKEVGKGSGLGLSVVQSIVESHGGKMEIESKVGQGTTVHLLFPVKRGRISSGSRS